MAAGGRILLVDDDPDIRAMLCEYFSVHGFEVAEAEGGASMRAALQAQVPDVVLLDLRLAGEDGLELARFLRQNYELGIIMVTAAGEVVDRIVGLEVGADDYLAKPFEPRELLARVKGLLRRLNAGAPARQDEPEGAGGAAAAAATRMPVGDCLLDLDAHRLVDADGREIALTAMEFDLLKALVERPNRVLSRDQLLTLTRNREWEPFDRSIDIRIARLRRKIEPEPARPRHIRTVRGAGYMFVP